MAPVGGTSEPTPSTGYKIAFPGPSATGTAPASNQIVWQTAMYPWAQASALAASWSPWPEVWGCGSDSAGNLSARCEMNGACAGAAGGTGACVCSSAWRGPTCAALKLRPTPRHAGFRHTDSSSWGGSVVEGEGGTWHMFSSFILGNCGLDAWSINSEIIRAVADHPLGPYRMVERVAGPFAHEPNLVHGRLKTGDLMLLGTMNKHTDPPPAGLINCTANPPPSPPPSPSPPPPPSPSLSPPPPPLPSRARARARERLGASGGVPPKDTYAWVARTPEGMATAVPRLVVDSIKWNSDVGVHHTDRTARHYSKSSNTKGGCR